MMSDNYQNGDSTSVIIGLLFLLIILVLLLLYLYKHLNRKTDGQYTVQRLVFSPGGLRDRVMQAMQAVESRVRNLRSRLQNHDEEEGSDEDNQDGNDDEKRGEAQEGRAQNVCTGEDKDEQYKDNSSDDYSNVDLRERVKQSHTTEEQKKEEEKEESEDGAENNESKQSEDEKNEERVALLIDLKSFSGSAIWSGEKEGSNVTAL